MNNVSTSVKFYRQVLAGPLLFAITVAVLHGAFGFKGAASIGTTLWMGLWWILRPVNIAVTALVPIAVNALFDLVPMGQVIGQYFSEIIVLLFGADMVCMTWSNTGLDKRLSLKSLCLIGPSMKQQIAVWLIASALLSVFLPNAVVCTIMVPVAISMLNFIGDTDIKKSLIAVPILLAIAWGAGIGGFGSPLGGAANLVAISYIEELSGKEFIYLDWVVRFIPFLVIIIALNLFYLWSLPLPVKKIEGTTEYFREMYAKLGSVSRGERVSMMLFVTATVLSFVRPLFASALPGFKPAYIFLVMGLLAFVFFDEKGTPLLTWQQVEKNMMWGMLYLFGGGLALGKMVTGTGAAAKFAEYMAAGDLDGGFMTFFAFVVFSSGLSEVSSNTAAAAIAVPIVVSITKALNVNSIPYLLVAIVAFNSAYVLPVSVRAIPVGFGLDPQALICNGFKLTLLSILTITVVGYLFSRYWVLYSFL